MKIAPAIIIEKGQTVKQTRKQYGNGNYNIFVSNDLHDTVFYRNNFQLRYSYSFVVVNSKKKDIRDNY